MNHSTEIGAMTKATLHLCDGIEFLRGLPDQSIDGIFTDPPWGSGPPIPGQEHWLDLVHDMDHECARILRSDARVLIWIGTVQIGPLLRVISHLQYRWMLLCNTIPMRWVGDLRCEAEFIPVFTAPGARLYRYEQSVEKKPQIYRRVSRGHPDTNHPCARPFHVVAQILNDWFAPGERIVDPFAGSDTTGVAARELGILYDGCEIDETLYRTGIVRAQLRLFQ